MNKINLNELRDCAYRIAREHRFHDKEFSNMHYLMLVITELSEAVEADRKGKRADLYRFKRVYERHKTFMEIKYAFEKYIKDSVEDELADAVIRMLDLAGLRGVDLSEIAEQISVYACKKRAEFFDLNSSDFTELIFSVIAKIVKIYNIPDIVNIVITLCFTIAHAYDIDLLWHIEQKMKYNELRPKLHEKKY